MSYRIIITKAKNESDARKKFNKKFAQDYPSLKRGQIAITEIRRPNKYSRSQGTTEWVIWFRTRKTPRRR